eukprot:3054021-Prymnesium_polylepis.1
MPSVMYAITRLMTSRFFSGSRSIAGLRSDAFSSLTSPFLCSICTPAPPGAGGAPLMTWSSLRADRAHTHDVEGRVRTASPNERCREGGAQGWAASVGDADGVTGRRRRRRKRTKEPSWCRKLFAAATCPYL